MELLESLNQSKQMINDNIEKHVGLLEEVKISHTAEIIKAELGGWGRFFIGAGIGLGVGIIATIIVVNLIEGNQ